MFDQMFDNELPNDSAITPSTPSNHLFASFPDIHGHYPYSTSLDIDSDASIAGVRAEPTGIFEAWNCAAGITSAPQFQSDTKAVLVDFEAHEPLPPNLARWLSDIDSPPWNETVLEREGSIKSLTSDDKKYVKVSVSDVSVDEEKLRVLINLKVIKLLPDFEVIVRLELVDA